MQRQVTPELPAPDPSAIMRLMSEPLRVAPHGYDPESTVPFWQLALEAPDQNGLLQQAEAVTNTERIRAEAHRASYRARRKQLRAEQRAKVEEENYWKW